MDAVTLLPAGWPMDWGTVQLVLLALIALVGLLLLAVVAAVVVMTLRRRRAGGKAPAAPGGAWLWARSGVGAGAQYALAHPTTLLGSGPGVHVSIPHPHVAPRHAVVSRQGAGFVLQDLGSPHGTFVNNQRVSGTSWVRPGDVINLGGAVELVLRS